MGHILRVRDGSVLDVKLVEIHIRSTCHGTGNGDGRAIRGQQVAYELRTLSGNRARRRDAVIIGQHAASFLILGCLAQQGRMCWKSDDFDSVIGIANVRESNGRTRELILLLRPDLELIDAARQTIVAANSHMIRVPCARVSGQGKTQASIKRIPAVEILWQARGVSWDIWLGRFL